MIKYYKNFILCGDVDYFCLLCNESFELLEDIGKHIRWEKHRKLIKTQSYLPKLKNDGIYKMENIYYCEFCSFVGLNFKSIKKHINAESHKCIKENPEDIQQETLAKRDSGFVIVANTPVSKKEWHGVVQDHCLFCNTTVDRFDTHIEVASHMISFIQAKIIREKDNRIYRKINEDTIHCFICKKTFNIQFLDSHWTSEEHSAKEIKHNGINNKLLFDIDKDNYIATCVLCKKILDLSYVPMAEHRKEHINNNEWGIDDRETEHALLLLHFQDRGKLRSDLKNFGKDHFIKLNEGGRKGFCSLCKIYVSAHIKNFKQHVNGISHKSHLELKGLLKKTKKSEMPRFKTKPFKSILKDIIHVKSARAFLINGKMSISILSFTLVAPADSSGKRIICYLCDEVYPDAMPHIMGEHAANLFKVEVVTTLKDEFVREIRPHLYHCGVCNGVFAGWFVLEKHLSTFKHRCAKAESKKELESLITSSLQENFCSNIPDVRTVDILD